MTYAVFSDEPMQPPEPKFDDVKELKSIHRITLKPHCLVGGLPKFLGHLGIPQEVSSLSATQSETLTTYNLLNRQGVFTALQDDVLQMKEKRCLLLLLCCCFIQTL
jgi:hypothetical protein